MSQRRHNGTESGRSCAAVVLGRGALTFQRFQSADEGFVLMQGLEDCFRAIYPHFNLFSAHPAIDFRLTRCCRISQHAKVAQSRQQRGRQDNNLSQRIEPTGKVAIGNTDTVAEFRQGPPNHHCGSNITSVRMADSRFFERIAHQGRGVGLTVADSAIRKHFDDPISSSIVKDDAATLHIEAFADADIRIVANGCVFR